MCSRIMQKLSGVDANDDSTPLPTLKVALVAMVFLANNFSLIVVYPLIPFMVHDFYPTLGANELGWRAGYLGASFNVGQVIMSSCRR